MKIVEDRALLCKCEARPVNCNLEEKIVKYVNIKEQEIEGKEIEGKKSYEFDNTIFAMENKKLWTKIYEYNNLFEASKFTAFDDKTVVIFSNRKVYYETCE